ncbi:DUF1413 domain-containing protein [Nitrosomonas sp.]|uniref:DUF1413 domain-containing protein n=1 Tax=Nitrosomonas sp. TaxID=42353 RepID=UPI0025D52FB0|nr:DUF1413 domain-containing protein [Nitrosomonas sp.]
MLNQEEKKKAQDIIDQKSKGTYPLNALYGDEWGKIPHQRSFGKKFKATVEDGQLTGIELSVKKTDNHQTYKVLY